MYRSNVLDSVLTNVSAIVLAIVLASVLDSVSAIDTLWVCVAEWCTVDVENQVLCTYTLKDDDLTKLRDAIEDLYYFEFVIGKSHSLITWLC